jgi:MoxR-like ATPase
MARPKKVVVDETKKQASNELMSAVKKSTSLRPDRFIIPDADWETLAYATLKGKNVALIGSAGCGKTTAAQTMAEAFRRPFFYFTLASMQDARSSLIGTVHFDKEEGTYVSESLFIKAIQTEGAVILPDELSRASDDALNILMTVLDHQRYLRIDESPNSPTINVARGVTFIGTANVGMEYTSTRVLDKAFDDRFQLKIEMKTLDKDQTKTLLRKIHPNLHQKSIDILASIYGLVREQYNENTGKISTDISVRALLTTAEMIEDGFPLMQAIEATIFPRFSDDGGVDSERTFIKQTAQKFIPDTTLTNDNMFEE